MVMDGATQALPAYQESVMVLDGPRPLTSMRVLHLANFHTATRHRLSRSGAGVEKLGAVGSGETFVAGSFSLCVPAAISGSYGLEWALVAVLFGVFVVLLFCLCCARKNFTKISTHDLKMTP